MKKKIFFTLILTLSLAKLHAKDKSPSVQPVNVKIGYTVVEAILDFLPEIKIIRSECESFEKQLQKQLDIRARELQQKSQAFEQGYEAMTEETRNKKQLELQRLHKKFQLLYSETEEKFNSKRMSLLEPVHEKVMNAIKQVAEENGFTHIFNTNVLIHVDAKHDYDISDDVLKKLGIDLAAMKSQKK